MRIAIIGAAVAAAALGFGVSGCATIIKGTKESISVNTTPEQGAACTLVNSEGTWYVTTPGSTTVHRTKNDLTITCTKDGYDQATQTVRSEFNGMTAGNIIAGGLIGVGVDAASGANYNYPQSIEVPMTKTGSASAAPAAAPTPAAPAATPGS